MGAKWQKKSRLKARDMEENIGKGAYKEKALRGL